MLQFGVGDEVHVINKEDEYYDQCGYVVEIDSSDPGLPYWVCFSQQGEDGEGFHSWFADHELEPAEAAIAVPTEDLI